MENKKRKLATKKITNPKELAKMLYEKNGNIFGDWDSPQMYDCVRNTWIQTAKNVLSLAKRGRI